MESLGDEVDRIVIITLNRDGFSGSIFSNAHSDPEMTGMLYDALDRIQGVDDTGDD